MMVAIIILGIGAIAYLLWQRSVVAATLMTTPVSVPGTQSKTIGAVINAVPIVGPILGPVENAAGSAIVNSKYLGDHSQVVSGTGGSSQGKTLSSAGISGFTLKKGGWSYSEVGSGLKKAVEFWKW